jgi:Family of unknown function (DUF6011)
MANKIRCGKGHYHESVADVRACYNGERVQDVATDEGFFPRQDPKPTAKQLSFIENLLNKSGLQYVPGLDTLNRRSASAVIDTLKGGSAALHPDFELLNPANSFANGTAHIERQTFERVDIPGLGTVPLPKAPAFDPHSLEDGFYALPDPEGAHLPVVYKVVRNVVQGDGTRAYAKRLNTDTGEWDMARGSISLLRPEHKMTLEQALKVAKVVAKDVNGALYGRCFKCGRTLTAEDSIERFMGPVCAQSFE